MLAAGRIRLCICMAVAALVMATSQACAQALLEFFFGARPAPAAAPSATPVPVSTASVTAASIQQSAAPRQSAAYCVRLCDGFFFPIQPPKTATSTQLCNTLCPASPSKVFHGNEIKHAVAADGARYAALANAFAYRKQIAPHCTCNGKDHYGLATVAIGSDPTLRAGDMVATREGVLAPVR